MEQEIECLVLTCLRSFECLIYPKSWDGWSELKIVSHFHAMLKVREVHKQRVMHFRGGNRSFRFGTRWRLSAGSGT